jgi:menaquinone-specific isochorismate synthase
VKISEPDRSSFSAIHAEILSGIGESRFQKVVPFVGQEIDFTAPLFWTMWPNAFSHPGSQFAFGFQMGMEGMCGITPELLFRVKNGRLTTAALAGTGEADGPPLLADKKEMLEHNLVVDSIRSALADLGAMSIGSTIERPYGKLKHLYTPITVELQEPPQFLDLVNRLHPTAALGGLPRMAAMDFLRLRGGERKRFGAPFGYSVDNEMVCVVAIRALQWAQTRACLMAGCGVVQGSLAESEWAELTLKRKAAASQLGLQL